MTSKTTIFDVAKFILESIGGQVSTMKLQKLYYYCQAWNLVWEGATMFKEVFYAKQNGVVCNELFKEHLGEFFYISRRIKER